MPDSDRARRARAGALHGRKGHHDAGQVVGTYGAYGFVATPLLAVTAPEPTALALLGAGLAGLGAVARRRRPARPTVARDA